MIDRYPDDPIEEREFEQVHGHDDREDFRHHSELDERPRLGTSKPAALLDLEDEAA